MPPTPDTPDRIIPCNDWCMQYLSNAPSLIFRMCRTPDCKRVVTAWLMHEDEDKTFTVEKGWHVPSTPLPHPYEIRQTEDRGRGMFAVRDIQFGGIILREMPLVMIPSCMPGQSSNLRAFADRCLLQLLYWLEPADRALFLSMHNCKPYDEGTILSGILRTNAFGLEFPEAKNEKFYAAVLRDMSFINHSCSPNSEYTQDRKTLIFELRAYRDISAGEEITINYCSKLEPHTERRRELLKKYCFLCICRACTVSPSSSDELRGLISRAMGSYHSTWKVWLTVPEDSRKELTRAGIEYFKTTLDALKKEEIISYRAVVLQRLAFFHHFVGEVDKFVEFGTRALKVLKATHEDDEMAEKWEDWLRDPTTYTVDLHYH